MKNTITAALIGAALLLTVVPSMAEQAEKQPAAASQAEESQPNAGKCAAQGKCCGSAACTAAKKDAVAKGKAAVADCPCRRNRKPDHTH